MGLLPGWASPQCDIMTWVILCIRTLVILADKCYTIIACSANDAFMSFKTGLLIQPIGKEIHCVSTCFRAWAAIHDTPPSLALLTGYRVIRPHHFPSFAAPPLCAFSCSCVFCANYISSLDRANIWRYSRRSPEKSVEYQSS